MGLRHHIYGAMVAAALLVVVGLPAPVAAEDDDQRDTLQERYASTDGRMFAHLTTSTIVRDDFYRSFGVGFDGGYFPSEDWGLELRLRQHFTSLSHTGQQMFEDHEMVPDMRAPDTTLEAGGRLSWGYGKVLTLGDFVVHFDPQLLAHGGLTLAEERIVPKISGGIGFLTHWRWGIQAKLDLQISVHFEQRDRGVVPATGFVPLLGVGWSPGWGDSE